MNAARIGERAGLASAGRTTGTTGRDSVADVNAACGAYSNRLANPSIVRWAKYETPKPSSTKLMICSQISRVLEPSTPVEGHKPGANRGIKASTAPTAKNPKACRKFMSTYQRPACQRRTKCAKSLVFSKLSTEVSASRLISTAFRTKRRNKLVQSAANGCRGRSEAFAA